MKYAGLLLACLVITPLAAPAGELFRWVDKAGKVHYSDVPPADTADVERKNFSSTVSQNEDLPYETRRAQQNFPVTLYVGPGCGATCNDARSLLSKRGIPFTETSLKTREDVEAFRQRSGIDGVPVLLIGRTYLRGLLEAQWHNELDVAGYPKTPPYRGPAKPAASGGSPEKPAGQ